MDIVPSHFGAKQAHFTAAYDILTGARTDLHEPQRKFRVWLVFWYTMIAEVEKCERLTPVYAMGLSLIRLALRQLTRDL